MNWLDGIRKEDLHERYREMIDVMTSDISVGGVPPLQMTDADAVALVLRLSAHYKSQSVYFISLNEIISERKKQFIIKHFNGTNHAELARKAGFSVVYVYEILAADRNKKQTSLF